MAKAEKFVREDFNTNAVFCLFGHSFEFVNDHNWNVLESFCDYIGHRDEIWYTTCIRIFDYVAATKEMIFTSDCTAAVNPTATEISLWADGRVLAVRAGETIKL
jgi:hypothetical protein